MPVWGPFQMTSLDHSPWEAAGYLWMCSDAQVEEEECEWCGWDFNGILSRMVLVQHPRLHSRCLLAWVQRSSSLYITNLLGGACVPLFRTGVHLSGQHSCNNSHEGNSSLIAKKFLASRSCANASGISPIPPISAGTLKTRCYSLLVFVVVTQDSSS